MEITYRHEDLPFKDLSNYVKEVEGKIYFIADENTVKGRMQESYTQLGYRGIEVTEQGGVCSVLKRDTYAVKCYDKDDLCYLEINDWCWGLPTKWRREGWDILPAHTDSEWLVEVADTRFFPKLFGVANVERFYLVVEEWVEGERLDRCRLSTQEVLSLYRWYKKLISYCATKGVLALDLRPKNIIKTKEGFKCIDLGFFQGPDEICDIEFDYLEQYDTLSEYARRLVFEYFKQTRYLRPLRYVDEELC